MFGQPYIKHMILKMGSLLSGHLGINLVTDRIKTTVWHLDTSVMPWLAYYSKKLHSQAAAVGIKLFVTFLIRFLLSSTGVFFHSEFLYPREPDYAELT